MSRFAFLLLLSCLVWQGLPGSRGAGPATSVELAHNDWHADVDAHHHHDDGSAHFDDSDDSIPHNHVDQGTGSVLVSEAAGSSLPPLQPPTPRISANAHAAHWYPDVPLRPPRTLA
jgi:hypothetical protein